MHTWKLEIEYEGTRWRGWQIQHNEKTIQSELQVAAYQLFSGKVEVGGACRTDVGVHAVGQIAHLKVSELNSNVTPRQIQQGFNDLLPHDINVLKVSNAPENFHAQRDAAASYYLYQISTRRAAFAKHLVWWNKDLLNIAEMSECAEMLVGKHDFASFCQFEEDSRQPTIIRVENAEIFTDGDLVCFRIGANHFLWKMVRRLVGMIAEVGRGNASVKDFQRLLKFKSNAGARFTAPPSGLFLEKIVYPGDTPPREKRALFPV